MSWLSDLARNCVAGARLAALLPVRTGDFRISVDQVVALALLDLVCAFAGSWATAEAPRAFYSVAFESWAFELALVIGFAYLVTRFAAPGALLGLCVILMSPTLLQELVFNGVDGVLVAVGEIDDRTALAVNAVLWGWLGIAVYRSLRLAVPFGAARSGLSTAALLAALWWLAGAIPATPFWETEYEPVAQLATDVDAETLLFEQSSRVDAALTALRPERPGVADLYFVGFAGDATQDVFMREVEYVRDLFDRRFDTAGRSIALINNPARRDSTPVASATNLAAVLEGVGRRMNPEQDVLFLFLTGHGTDRPELDVAYPPLPLRSIDPEWLEEALDRSEIRWRIIVVSACYSGGFLETLEDDTSLVVTASAPDRESFGCSHEAEFTYFGRALFKEELAEGSAMLAAVEGAARRVSEWEAAEGREPSQPQYSLGGSMTAKLAEVEARADAGSGR